MTSSNAAVQALRSCHHQGSWTAIAGRRAVRTSVLAFDVLANELEGLIEAKTISRTFQRYIVLDPFGGSGTTLIAADNPAAFARLIEFDPIYCDVIVRRYGAYTGKRAKLAATGQVFEDVTEVRAIAAG